MLQGTLRVFATGLLASGLMLSTASASMADVAASGCHLGNHPHAESSWAWLVVLLLPLLFRSRLFGRR
jgi:hypothetical protein